MTWRARAALLVFIAYIALALVTMWALFAHIGSVVPDGPQPDYHHFIWNYWWARFALQEGVSPWYTDYVLYPNTHNLSLHTMTLIWFPAFALVEPVMGRVAAVNAFVLISLPITGLATYLWLRPWLPKNLPGSMLAFLGGLLFAFQPYLLFSAQKTHLNIIAMWWLPVTLSLWREVVSPRKLSRPTASILLGLALCGCWLTDFQYAIFLPQTLGLYGLWTLWANRRHWRWLSLTGWGLVALAIMFGLMWFIWPLPPLREIDTGNPYLYPPAGIQTVRDWVMPLKALVGLAPNVLGRTLGAILPLLGWLSLVLVVRRAFAKSPAKSNPLPPEQPPAWFWLLSAMPSLTLMLGAEITIAGRSVSMPYLALHELLNGQYRTPERFVIPAVFSIVTFVALAWSPLVSRLTVRSRPAVLGATLLISMLFLADVEALGPFPTRPVKDYDIHREIGQEDADYVIFDLPVGTHYGWTGLGEGGQFTQIYAPVHQKRMVNGFLARMAFPDYAFYSDSPMFTWLAQGYPIDAAQEAQIRAEFNHYLHEWPVGYVFAHRQWMTEEQQSLWIGWMNTIDGLCAPEIAEDTLLLWWRNADLGCGEGDADAAVNLGAARDWLHVGPGWYWQEDIGGVSARWSGQTAVLRFNTSAVPAYELTFTATAFHEARTLTVGAQQVEIGPDGWHTYTLTIAADTVAGGLLTLEHDTAVSSESLGLSTDTRPLAVAYSEVGLAPVDSE